MCDVFLDVTMNVDNPILHSLSGNVGDSIPDSTTRLIHPRELATEYMLVRLMVILKSRGKACDGSYLIRHNLDIIYSVFVIVLYTTL